MPQVLVIGDINVDVVSQFDGALNQNSDTPARTSITLGGSPSNMSTWLAHSDVRVFLLGGVGDDLFGSWSLQQLGTYGVDTSLVTVFGADRTGTCVILVNQMGDRTMLPDPGANLQVSPDAEFDGAIDDADIVVMSAYSFIRPETREMAEHAVRRARANGCCVVLDAASAAPIQVAGPTRVREWLLNADFVIANEDEVEALGSDTTSDWRSQLGNLIVKRGARGASWFRNGQPVCDVQATAVDVIDTTGAGDAFLAGVVASLTVNENWHEVSDDVRRAALASGAQLAGECCSRVGATPGTAT